MYHSHASVIDDTEAVHPARLEMSRCQVRRPSSNPALASPPQTPATWIPELYLLKSDGQIDAEVASKTAHQQQQQINAAFPSMTADELEAFCSLAESPADDGEAAHTAAAPAAAASSVAGSVAAAPAGLYSQHCWRYFAPPPLARHPTPAALLVHPATEADWVGLTKRHAANCANELTQKWEESYGPLPTTAAAPLAATPLAESFDPPLDVLPLPTPLSDVPPPTPPAPPIVGPPPDNWADHANRADFVGNFDGNFDAELTAGRNKAAPAWDSPGEPCDGEGRPVATPSRQPSWQPPDSRPVRLLGWQAFAEPLPDDEKRARAAVPVAPPFDTPLATPLTHHPHAASLAPLAFPPHSLHHGADSVGVDAQVTAERPLAAPAWESSWEQPSDSEGRPVAPLIWQPSWRPPNGRGRSPIPMPLLSLEALARPPSDEARARARVFYGTVGPPHVNVAPRPGSGPFPGPYAPRRRIRNKSTKSTAAASNLQSAKPRSRKVEKLLPPSRCPTRRTGGKRGFTPPARKGGYTSPYNESDVIL